MNTLTDRDLDQIRQPPPRDPRQNELDERNAARRRAWGLKWLAATGRTPSCIYVPRS